MLRSPHLLTCPMLTALTQSNCMRSTTQHLRVQHQSCEHQHPVHGLCTPPHFFSQSSPGVAPVGPCCLRAPRLSGHLQSLLLRGASQDILDGTNALAVPWNHPGMRCYPKSHKGGLATRPSLLLGALRDAPAPDPASVAATDWESKCWSLACMPYSRQMS